MAGSGLRAIWLWCSIQVVLEYGAAAVGCIHDKVSHRRSKKSTDCRSGYNAHIVSKCNRMGESEGLGGGEDTSPPACSGAMCGAFPDRQCERRRRDSFLCRVVAARVSSRLGETVRGGSPGAGSRGINRGPCSVRHQTPGGESLYSKGVPPVFPDPSIPKIPGPTIGRFYCTALMCRPFGVGGGVWFAGGGTEVELTVKATGIVTDAIPVALSVIVPL